jgi:hypothetical protein
VNKAHAAKLKQHQEDYAAMIEDARESIAEMYESWHDNYMNFHDPNAVGEAQVRRAWRPVGLQRLSRVSEELGVHPNGLADIAKDFHLGDLWEVK